MKTQLFTSTVAALLVAAFAVFAISLYTIVVTVRENRRAKAAGDQTCPSPGTTQSSQGFPDGRGVMTEIIHDGNTAHNAANFHAAFNAFEPKPSRWMTRCWPACARSTSRLVATRN